MPHRVCLIGNFLSEYGHTPKVCETLSDHFAHRGMEVIRAGCFEHKMLRFLHMTVLPAVKRDQYDVLVIDTYSGSAFYFAAASGMMARFTRKPYVALLHGGNLPVFHNRHKRAVSWYLKNAARIVCPSPYLSSWVESLGYSGEVIPNPLDINQYTPKRRTNVSPRLFWFRRFHQIYNPQMAIKALWLLRKSVENASMIMAGPDSGERDNCVRLAERLDVISSIEFRGLLSKKEINEIGQKCDIFINTSSVDNTPVSLIEAAAMGLPIVSTDAGGIPVLFTSEQDALLVSTDDPWMMACAIERLLKDARLVKELTGHALGRIQEFSWEKVYPKWNRLFQELAAGSTIS